MKKVISILLVTIMICGLMAGCGGEEEVKQISAEKIADVVEKVQEAVAVEEEKETADAVTIEEAVVFDGEGVRITVKGIEEGWTGTDIKLLVENSTNKNIAVSGDTAIVNGVTISAFTYIDVAAGKKTNGTMSLYSSELEKAGINQIATVVAKDAHIVDTDSFDTVTDSCFAIETSVGADYVQAIDESGDILYEAKGVSVISKTISDGVFGEEVILFMKNDSGKDVTVEADNISVNGFTIDAWMYDTVYADTVRFCALDIFGSSLEENEITEVEDVCFTIKLIDPDSFSTIAQSDEIQIFVNE